MLLDWHLGQLEGQLPFVTYTANTLVNSILSEFSEKAKRCKAKVDYSIIIGSQLNMEDIDLCRMLTNILENAVEGCKKVSGERRFIDILSSIGESCEIWKYTSALGLESALQEDSGAYDILILDIMLEEINGVSFTEYFRNHGNCVPVIFISSSEKFVFDAYSAEPVGYILKPVSKYSYKEVQEQLQQYAAKWF